MVHVKDMIKKPTPAATPEQVMVDVGKGSIDWKAIFAHSGHAGIQHYFVEHDQPPQPLVDIKTSFDYLNGLEF
jgi:sugar phosphate isomerase/epimerase